MRPLVESIGLNTMISADVTNDAEMDAAFAQLKAKFGTIDFLVHAIAFAGKEELQGSMVANTTREGFRRAMDISVYSFIDAVAPRIADDAERRLDHKPDLSGLGAGRALLQRDGRRQGGA